MSNQLTMRLVHTMIGPLMALFLSAFALTSNAQVFRLGVPPWPGVQVKSEVAVEILQILGYQAKQDQLSVPIIFHSLTTDSLDIYLGGWVPQEKNKIEKYTQQGKIIKLTTNTTDALIGLAVPEYMAKRGVKSMADLKRYADKFDHKIYGIERGSGINKSIQSAIDQDRHDLGDWDLVQTGTGAMLAQVKRAISKKKPVVFFAWRPHWMNVSFNIHYLTVDEPSDIAHSSAAVYTLVSKELPQKAPNVTRFLKQMHVDSTVQSQWVHAYSRENDKLTAVSHNWIKNNMDVVSQWLDGVKTADGKPALPAVRAAFGT
ncbi:ABC transporter substrate-binding protein [Salinisphaera sp. USBA-960]|uniref:ABC transporter substrate-binding protein n=1 Tax=Salinisphaera orenii TaxID=856731 RepID=UPI0013A5F720|nr:ABC transporter substrate-binding protein [Salifodinibacter halophilus]NNC25722.1 ABC transporter substrate-binding protein [Salifodinibacter halophilus]